MALQPILPQSNAAPVVRFERSAGCLRQVIDLPAAFAVDRIDLASAASVEAACAALTAATSDEAFERDLTRIEALIADLGRDARLIAFFGGGVSSMASQAVAQFAGWNIPGVGEGEQRYRPRTRLYDTVDPDTLAQVRETLAYGRTSFVFTTDARCAAAVRTAADVFLPAIRDAIGADEIGNRVAALVGASGDAADRALAEAVSAAGGRVIELASGGDVLPVAELASGIARAVDARAMRRGALALIDEVRARPEQLAWPAVLAQVGSVQTLAMADRFAAFSAWWAAQSNASASAGPLFLPASQAMIGQDPAVLGLGRGDGAVRALDLLTVGWSHVGAHETAGAAAEASIQDFTRAALAAGHPVRRLVLPGYDATSLGAAMALARVEAGVLGR